MRSFKDHLRQPGKPTPPEQGATAEDWQAYFEALSEELIDYVDTVVVPDVQRSTKSMRALQARGDD